MLSIIGTYGNQRYSNYLEMLKPAPKYQYRVGHTCPGVNSENTEIIDPNQRSIQVKGNREQTKCTTGEFTTSFTKDNPPFPFCVNMRLPEGTSKSIKASLSFHNNWEKEREGFKEGDGFIKFGMEIQKKGNEVKVETATYEHLGDRSGVKDVNMSVGRNNASLCIDEVDGKIVIRADYEEGKILDRLSLWNLSVNEMYKRPPVSIALNCETDDFTISGKCFYQEIRSREINDNVKKVQETYGYIIGIGVIAALGLGLLALLYVCCDCDNRCDNRSENTSSEPRGSEARGSEARPENTTSETGQIEMQEGVVAGLPLSNPGNTNGIPTGRPVTPLYPWAGN